MKSWVGTFLPRTGTGTQTITGIVDRDGAAFTPKFVLFQSGYAALNILTTTGTDTVYADFHGADNLTDPVAMTRADCLGAGVGKFLGGFQTPAGGGATQASLLDHDAAAAFGGVTYRLATVTAVASGSFTLTYTVNSRTGDAVLCTVLGGDDFDIDQHEEVTNGTITTTGPAQAVLTMSHSFSAQSGWGWDTRESDRGVSICFVQNQGGNSRYQRSDTCAASVDVNTNTVVTGAPYVSAWGDTSYTIAGSSDIKAFTQFAFSGTDLIARAGVFTQPTTTGQQTVTLGLDAQWLMVVSRGAEAGTTLLTDQAETALGWTDGTRQVGFWAGENTVGNVGSVNGARYLSNASLLRFATPDSTSTTFDAVASLVELNPTGTLTLDWTTVDSTEREILWFALGVDHTPPTPVYHTRTFTRRRVRRSPIVWAEHDGLQARIRVNLFAVDMQPGTATSDTPDPQVMVRASKDGGHTWTDWRQISAGRVGAYTTRLNFWRWGQGRQWVFEVATSDPVTFYLVNAYLDAEPGTS